MKYLLITFLLLLSACGPKPHGPDSPYPPFSYSLPFDITQKQASYQNLAPSVQDEWGFVGSENCDALMMTSLLGAAGVPIADLYAAEDPAAPGKWSRRPEFRTDAPEPCYPDHSGSSISRDQLLGLMWYQWRTADLAGAKRLLAYADDHNLEMGEGDEFRTGLRVNMYQTLTLLIAKLEGHAMAGTLIPLPDLTAQTGYQAHLQVLHILLRGELTGDIGAYDRLIIQKLAEKNPDSPIMQAAAARWYSGDYWDNFLSAARNTQYFPNNRLPTSADRCIDWATQQANPADWAPCPTEGHTHSPGDWLFAVSIVTHS